MRPLSMLIGELKRSLPSQWFENIGEDLYQRYVKIRLKYLNGVIETTGTEYPIEFVRIETGKKEKLIFLPGFADQKENFFHPAQFLIEEFDMIIPDLPGFGKSFRRVDENYSLENYGRWLCQFIEEIGWTDFHLVGNSLGGAIAIQLALMLPEKVRTLTVIDPAAIVLPERHSLYHEFIDGRNIFIVHTHEQFKYFLNRVFFKPPVIPLFIWEHFYKEFSDNSRWYVKIMNDLLGGIKDFSDPRLESVSLNHRLPEIKQPTLIIWGDEDSFFPSEIAEYMKTKVPHAKLYILFERGHSPQVESPFQFAKIIKKFIRDTVTAADGV